MRTNELVSLGLDVVAVYRLSRLIVEDRITDELREYIHEHLPSEVSYLFNCPWCISIWAAIAIITLRKINPEIADYLSTILTASAITGAVYNHIR